MKKRLISILLVLNTEVFGTFLLLTAEQATQLMAK